MYSGTVAEIPIGLGGLTGSRNQAKIRPDQLLDATNVSYDTGNLAKEGGANKYNTSAISGAPDVVAGWDWWPDTVTQRMIVVLSDNTIRKDIGAGTFPTTLATGFTAAGAVPVFVEGGKEAAANTRKLFVFNGSRPVAVLAGDAGSMNPLATPPADWSGANQPSFGFIHDDKLWGGGNGNDFHRLYYSTASNHEDFTSAGAGTISVFPGEGEKIVGAMSFKGLVIVFKYPKGIYLIDTSDASTANWQVKRLTASVGTVSPQSFVQIDDDILFMDAGGNFQLLSAVTEFGDMANRNLSADAELNTFMRNTFNFAKFPLTRAVYYAYKREAHFCLAGLGSVNLNARMVIDFNGPAPRFRYSNRDTNHSIWLRKDAFTISRVMIGESGGFVYELDQSTKDKNGSGYLSSFQTAHMDFGWLDPTLATKNKIAQFLEIVVDPTGDYELLVDVLWDNVYTETLSFNMGHPGTVVSPSVPAAALGSFTLGVTPLGLGGSVGSSGTGSAINIRHKMNGSGKRLSLRGRSSGSDEDFSIIRMYAYFKVGDEKNRGA